MFSNIYEKYIGKAGIKTSFHNLIQYVSTKQKVGAKFNNSINISNRPYYKLTMEGKITAIRIANISYALPCGIVLKNNYNSLYGQIFGPGIMTPFFFFLCWLSKEGSEKLPCKLIVVELETEPKHM